VRLYGLVMAVALALLMAAGAQAMTSFVRRSMAHARLDVSTELASAVLPHGARKVRRDPSVNRGLRAPGVACSKRYVVQKHRFWRVAGKAATVWSWMQRHPPARTGSIGASMTIDQGTPVAWYIWFFLPDQSNVVRRMVAVGLKPARGGGTAVRVSAIAVGEPHRNQAPCVIIY
jgi:hypothetical protein